MLSFHPSFSKCIVQEYVNICTERVAQTAHMVLFRQLRWCECGYNENNSLNIGAGTFYVSLLVWKL